MANDPVGFKSSSERIPGTGGSGVDELVKISSDDTTADYLEDKIAAGTGVTLNVLNPGGDEQLEIITDAIVTPNDEDIVIPFAFDDSSPIAITTLAVAANISKVRTVIDTAFDDSASTITVGLPGNVGLLQMANENDTSAVASYETWPDLELPIGSELQIELTPGTSTQGEGKVIVTLSR